MFNHKVLKGYHEGSQRTFSTATGQTAKSPYRQKLTSSGRGGSEDNTVSVSIS